MRTSSLLIGLAIVCIAGICVFQFVRHWGDKQPSDDTPNHEPKTHPQHNTLQPAEYYILEPWLKEDNFIILADKEGTCPVQVAFPREDRPAARMAQIPVIPAET